MRFGEARALSRVRAGGVDIDTALRQNARVRSCLFDRFVRLGSALLALLVWASSPVWVQQIPSTLKPMPREGGRYREGLILEPRNDQTIALVSALVSLKQPETFDTWPKLLRLRFFVPPDQPRPSIRIRQFRSYSGYYVLEDVKPAQPWKPGTVNEFSWPSDVVARAYDWQSKWAGGAVGTRAQWVRDLAIVVRLGDEGPIISGERNVVAPAALYYSDMPMEVVGYRFAFTTNAPATVKASIAPDGGGKTLAQESYNAIPGGLSNVVWSAAGHPAGWYSLRLDASFPGHPQMIVRFYHRRSLAS
jgi:hypothetical protein